MSERFILNPLTRIFLAANSRSNFVLENLESKQSLEISKDTLKVLNFCCRSRTAQEIERFFKDYLKNYKFELDKILKQLQNLKILIGRSAYYDKLKRYSVWFKYDWWMPLHYFLTTEGVTVQDKESLEPQTRILKKYLEKLPPSFYKSYSKSQKIDLPKPKTLHNASLFEVLMKRRTSRGFGSKLTLEELSTILHHGCCELKEIREGQIKDYYTNPSLLLKSHFIPFEIYILINKMESIKKGIYHYDVRKHRLELLKTGDFCYEIAMLAQGQTFLVEASVIILISAIFERFIFRYRQPRAYRELLATTSELAHFLIVFATRLGIKTFETPALKDSELANLLGIDGWHEDVLYLLALGK